MSHPTLISAKLPCALALRAGLRTTLAALFLLCIPVTQLPAQTPTLQTAVSQPAPVTSLTLSGQVLDPNSALIPGASLTLTQGATIRTVVSDSAGHYQFTGLSAGSYQLAIDATGFAQLIHTGLKLTGARELNLTLKLATDQQQVTVETDSNSLSVSNSDNVNTTVMKGSDLDALSDDPDQLRNELMALAGPASGPDGGQIYVDGFTTNQLPPKSSILEVRVNQNPFSSENDRIGYGRIDIITKPSATKLGGHVRAFYINSALDTSNPLVTSQPGYQFYSFAGDATGPFAKNASWSVIASYWERQRQSVVNAVNPNNTSARIAQAFPSPYSTLNFLPRIDVQFGNHVLSIRDSFFRTRTTGGGVGALSLPSQSYSNTTHDNVIMIRDFAILSPYLVNELGFQWERGSDDQMPDSTAPTINVQGAFIAGGSAAGQSSDHEDFLELHDYMTATHNLHVFRFGVRLRTFHDSSLSTAGSNSTYTFQSLAQYQAGTPSQYDVTEVKQPTIHTLPVDIHLFFQDEWRARRNLSIGYGLRIQGQSSQHNLVDFAPRVALTWAPHNNGTTAPRYAFHFGSGLFYSTINLGSLLQTIRQNGVNQQSYVVKNPSFYNPSFVVPPSSTIGSASTPSISTLDPHFHTSVTLQAGAGVDRSIGKVTTFNVSYLFSQGTHQFLTNLVTAQLFNASNYTLSGPAPSVYNYQFQSGGVFKQHQLIVTARTRYRRLSLSGTYTLNHARSDTQGAATVPSDSHNPGLDYGRAGFGITSVFSAVGSWSLPYRISASTIFYAQSGTPFNITTGSDLTGNAMYNARPTYGTCGATGVVTTSFGCLDAQPTGKGEPIVPINLGTGPANKVMNLSLTKTIAIGPHIKTPSTTDAAANAVTAAQNATLRPGQVSGPAAAAAPSTPRRYSLNFTATATNLFNNVNRGAPNGVLSSPLFGQSQSLATGAYASPSPGNRTIYLNTTFTF